MIAVADKQESDISKPTARLGAQFARFIESEIARWVRPAAVILEREGASAAAAYEQTGYEAEALEAVSEDEWTRYLERVWLSVTPRAGEFMSDAIEPLKAAKPPDPFMQAAISHLRMNGAERVKGITQTSRDEIGNQIRIGVQKGESRQQIADRITKHRRSITPERAMTIARTEVHAAANFGSLIAAEAVAVPMYKFWIARPDARDTHRAASGQRRSLAAAFMVGGYQLQYPGDGSMGAPAGLVVNCRCVLSFEVKRAVRPRRAA
jgi:hypothetical protein